MAKLSADPKASEQTRKEMLREVSMYVAPKLKAVEHKVDIDNVIEVRWVESTDTLPAEATTGGPAPKA
jgi:hypothetical protein